MEQIDYIIPFISIIYGIAMADLLSSGYRLVEERQRVTFHAIPLIWAFVCFLAIINGWWAFFQIIEAFVIDSAGKLLILSVLPTFTFLFSTAALPSRIREHCDLWQFYRANRYIFFGMFSAYLLSVPTILYFLFGQQNLLFIASQLIACVLLYVCIRTERAWWHWLVSLYFVYNIGAGLFNQSLPSV